MLLNNIILLPWMNYDWEIQKMGIILRFHQSRFHVFVLTVHHRKALSYKSYIGQSRLIKHRSVQGQDHKTGKPVKFQGAGKKFIEHVWAFFMDREVISQFTGIHYI